MSKKYIKKPVVVEAFQLGIDVIPEWFWEKVSFKQTSNKQIFFNNRTINIHDMYCEIKTLEGVMRGNYGDYIIRGIKGEIYPCKPDIFKETYEVVKE